MLRTIGGVCCIIIGIVGLVLPGIQGIALIALGFIMLGKKGWLHRMMDLLRRVFRRKPREDDGDEQRRSPDDT